MNVEQNKSYGSAMDLFMSNRETIEEAKQKSSDESSSRSKHFRITKDGTYSIRILPLAPVIDANGNVLPMERKGYEYPTRELVLKINAGADNKGKEKVVYVNVCNAKLAFPKLTNDLIECYVETACQVHSDDTALCKKLQETSFNGGLKYDSKRCMYIYDLDNINEGLQILQLSYAQYKELEERKLKLWGKLFKKDPQTQCPISSIVDAYPVEITRTTENKKSKYAFNIDNVSDKAVLTEEQLQTLLDSPRLPDALYRYTRYHLEATIAFLKQFDELSGISILNESAVQSCIDQIKLCLPSNDQSHFKTVSGGEDNDTPATGGIDNLWDMYDVIEKSGQPDQSEEGQNLRTAIREFIEDEELSVRVTRGKSNLTLLEEIQVELDGDVDSGRSVEEEDDEPAVPAPATKPVDEDEDEEDDEPAVPTRRTRNDDSNEPAVRPQRRTARPVRR